MKHLTSKIVVALVFGTFAGAANAAVTSKAYVDAQNTAQDTVIAGKSALQGTGTAGVVATVDANGQYIRSTAALADLATTTNVNTIVNDAVTDAVSQITGDISDMETKTNAAATYAVKATEGVASGAASAAAANATAIGTLASLTTTQKTNLVVAINEIKTILGTLDAATMADLITETDADLKYAAKATEGVASGAATNATAALTNIGTLASLTTSEKTNLVGAINEIKTILGTVDAATMADVITEAVADTKYAVKATEGVASTAATNASTALTNIGTLASLTTSEKTNVVGAINEVKASVATTNTDVSGKADKVTGATADNFATLNAAGNPTDSGINKMAFQQVQADLGTAQGTISTLGTAAFTASTAYATSAQGTAAEAAKVVTDSVTVNGTIAKANAAIPQPSGECTDCVLHYNGTAFTWEEIER